jgi:uncharacterized damage-inducible protein DinB
MARYNLWQNKQLMPVLKGMSVDDLMLDRGAFFGSILGTLNHLLWGDRLWMNRFDPKLAAPVGDLSQATTLYPNIHAWEVERFRTDGHIRLWADGLKTVDLVGDLSMYSRVLQADAVKPMSSCVVHFFNHQTHHRGQIHAMLTAAGQQAPVSDLFFMPEDL